MPYYRGRRRRRRRYNKYGNRYQMIRRPSNKPYRYKVADTAYNAYKMGMRAMKFLNTEFKHFDSTYSVNVDWNGNVNNLINAIPQGDTDQTRDGDSLKMMNFNMKYKIDCQGVDSNVRVIVFIDKQNSIGTSVTNFLTTAGANNSFLTPKNHDLRFYSQTLYDRTHSLSASGTQIVNVKKIIPLNKHIQFNAGLTTIRNNTLSILVISDIDTIAGTKPLFQCYNRVSFVDN